MSLESIHPTESHRIIDMVREVGIDVSSWSVKSDGSPCATPASNPNFCYEWCYHDIEQKLLLINIWLDETLEKNGDLFLKLNMKYIASNDPKLNRRRRAGALGDVYIKTSYSLALSRA